MLKIFSRYFFILCLTFGCVSPLFAGQNASKEDEKKILIDLVQQFFDAMAERDVEVSKSLLMAHGGYFPADESESQKLPARITNASYLESLSGRKDEVLERMWNPTVMVEGRVAMVWAPYDFHINGAFSHCGIDIFSLVKTNGKWQIASTVFSSKRQSCPEYPAIPSEEK